MDTTMPSKTFMGHPPALFVLFFTEMWERFSYYGMRALLVYYMMKELLFSQESSSQIYGLYTGFAYFTPLFGGIIADRYWGKRKSVIIGGVIMAIGEFMLFFHSLFFPALLLLILGNGLFKPNISTQVGLLYKEGDERRDNAFSLFYVGINLGAFFAPLVCGTIGERYGFSYGFMAAGFGMIAGLVVYLIFGKDLEACEKNSLKKESEVKAATTLDEKDRIVALLILCFFNILFWMVYEQQGNTIALWADSYTNRHLFGGSWEMPATWFQSVNPLMIFLFTPLLTSFWSFQAKRGIKTSSVTKMGVGCLLLGLSFLIMIPATLEYKATGHSSAWWLMGCFSLLTIGELYLSPVGLSLVTKVAPVRMVSMLMGAWFLSSFVGNYLSGFLGIFWDRMGKESFFIMLSLISFVGAFAFWFFRKRLRVLAE